MDNLSHHIRNALCGIELEMKHIHLSMTRIEKYMKRMDEAVKSKRAVMENIQLIRPTLQGVIRNDGAGQGHFGAPRGDHKHAGTDYVVTPHDAVFAVGDGKLIRSGYAYEGDSVYRLCEIRSEGIAVKLLYVYPFPSLIGEYVRAGDVIGAAQDITKKYSDDMLPHVHLEVRVNDVLVDPETFMVWQKRGASGTLK